MSKSMTTDKVAINLQHSREKEMIRNTIEMFDEENSPYSPDSIYCVHDSFSIN